jgi:lysophospholipase L1-like esterase
MCIIIALLNKFNMHGVYIFRLQKPNMKRTAALFFCMYLLTPAVCRSQSKTVPDSIYPPVNLIIPFHSETARIRYRDRIQEFKNNPLNYRDIVFIGNSITEGGGDWGKRFNLPNVKNRGISGDVSEGVLNRLGEICYFKAGYVFILIGINVKITNTIHQKSPATKIYVQTVLPTSNADLVDKIKDLNNLISGRRGHYTVLDTHSLFADGNDLIINKFTTDGVHLSEAGYAMWVTYLKNYFKIK